MNRGIAGASKMCAAEQIADVARSFFCLPSVMSSLTSVSLSRKSSVFSLFILEPGDQAEERDKNPTASRSVIAGYLSYHFNSISPLRPTAPRPTGSIVREVFRDAVELATAWRRPIKRFGKPIKTDAPWDSRRPCPFCFPFFPPFFLYSRLLFSKRKSIYMSFHFSRDPRSLLPTSTGFISIQPGIHSFVLYGCIGKSLIIISNNYIVYRELLNG